MCLCECICGCECCRLRKDEVKRDTYIYIHKHAYIQTYTIKGPAYVALATELTATSCRNFSLCRRVEKVCADWQLIGYS